MQWMPLKWNRHSSRYWLYSSGIINFRSHLGLQQYNVVSWKFSCLYKNFDQPFPTDNVDISLRLRVAINNIAILLYGITNRPFEFDILCLELHARLSQWTKHLRLWSSILQENHSLCFSSDRCNDGIVLPLQGFNIIKGK